MRSLLCRLGFHKRGRANDQGTYWIIYCARRGCYHWFGTEPKKGAEALFEGEGYFPEDLPYISQ